MATWDVFFPDVLVHATMAPDPLVRHALCRASREFFRRTRAWTEWLDAATATGVPGQEFDFDLPNQTEIVRIEQATKSGKPLTVQSYKQLAADWTKHPDEAESGQSLVSRDLVTFNLLGTVSGSVQVQASLMPSVRASGLPDHLANHYMEAIAQGAKGILLLTPDTEFYKPDLAGVAKAMFEQAIGTHSFDAFRGHTGHVPRARLRLC